MSKLLSALDRIHLTPQGMYLSSDQVAAVSSAVLYGVLSLSMAFLNKTIISSYGFDYPFFILFCQMTLTMCVMEFMKKSQKFHLPDVTISTMKMFCLPAFFYSLHATLSLLALEGMNIPMYAAIKRCTPLISLILSVTYLKKPMPSLVLISSILTVTIGCFIAGMSDPSFNGFAYLMGALSVISQASYLTLVQECGENKLKPLDILHLNSCISVVPFFILACVFGEMTKVQEYPHLQDLGFLCLFVLLIVLGLALNFSLFLCTILNSAVTTAVTGVVKSVLQTLIGFFTFGGVIFNPINIAEIKEPNMQRMIVRSMAAGSC
ncbi:uncharacterized protein LOC135195615 isoform X2 [Macrobrachium nipponense]|uniref:uncharacterized protein LOC135195615 isoform X2 n=1 Tax=Macrobrachium nipponense TaxID=159736 RepID=UPI0030C803A4